MASTSESVIDIKARFCRGAPVSEADELCPTLEVKTECTFGSFHRPMYSSDIS